MAGVSDHPADGAAPAGREGPDLRLTGASGWTVVLAFVACHVFLVVTTEPRSHGPLWSHAVGLLVFAPATAAVALLPDRRLTRALTAALAAVPALLGMLVPWETSTGDLAEHATWHVGAGTFVVVLLAVRVHLVASWCGMAGLLAVTLAWAGATGQGWRGLPDLLLPPLSLLLIGTVGGVVLRRASHRAAAVAARGQLRVADRAARLTEAAERNRRLAALEKEVRPPLERLAAGRVPGPDERRRLAALEAELRDRIRGAALDVPAVVEAVRAARLRGVVVEIMDDGGLATVPDAAAVLSPVPGLLDAVEAGRVVIRILPPGRAAVASIVVETAAGTYRRTIDREGGTVDSDARAADRGASALGEHHVRTGQGEPEPAVARHDLDEPQPER